MGGVNMRSLSGWWMVLPLLSVASLGAASDDLRLVEAVRMGDREAVRSLLGEHVDVNARQGDGATALAWAAHRDDVATTDLLIRAGADASAADDSGVTPLLLACTNRSAAMVELLLQAGANPDSARWSGETPLMTCARTGDVVAVKALLAHGAEVNAATRRGQTALMWAAAQQRPEIVRVLIEHGADVDASSRMLEGFTPAQYYRFGLAEYFDEEPAGEVHRDPEGQFGGFTPLMFAARVGDLESARILLGSGAEHQSRNAGLWQRSGGGDPRRPRGPCNLLGGARRGFECGRPLGIHTSPLRAAGGHHRDQYGPIPNASDRSSLVTAEHAGIGEGAAGTGRGSERSSPEGVSAIQLPRVLAHRQWCASVSSAARRDAVPAGRCSRRCRQYAGPAGCRRRSVLDHGGRCDTADGGSGIGQTLAPHARPGTKSAGSCHVDGRTGWRCECLHPGRSNRLDGGRAHWSEQNCSVPGGNGCRSGCQGPVRADSGGSGAGYPVPGQRPRAHQKEFPPIRRSDGCPNGAPSEHGGAAGCLGSHATARWGTTSGPVTQERCFGVDTSHTPISHIAFAHFTGVVNRPVRF